MARCRQMNWQLMRAILGAPPSGALHASKSAPGGLVMIVLKDKELPSVWEEANALHRLTPRDQLTHHRGNREQRFWWVNAIDYEFTHSGRRQRLSVHVVVCEETWQEANDHRPTLTKTARHAWLSSRPLTRHNVHERCNLGARHRRGIEAGFLVEKHQGYHYEHAFALNWNAMKGYHHLMRMAHLFNTLARFARHLKGLYAELGVHATIAFIRQSCAAPWLDPERITALLSQPFQLQLE